MGDGEEDGNAECDMVVVKTQLTIALSIGGIVGLSMMVVAMILMSVMVITFNPLSIENLIRCANLTLVAWFFVIGGTLIFWMCR